MSILLLSFCPGPFFPFDRLSTLITAARPYPWLPCGDSLRSPRGALGTEWDFEISTLVNSIYYIPPAAGLTTYITTRATGGPFIVHHSVLSAVLPETRIFFRPRDSSLSIQSYEYFPFAEFLPQMGKLSLSMMAQIVKSTFPTRYVACAVRLSTWRGGVRRELIVERAEVYLTMFRYLTGYSPLKEAYICKTEKRMYIRVYLDDCQGLAWDIVAQING